MKHCRRAWKVRLVLDQNASWADLYETGPPADSNPGSLSRDEEGDCGGLLFLERSWTADERTVPKIKSQEAVRIPRNADPNALPDFAGLVVTASEP